MFPRAALAASQHPVAIILSCSDSRVPPEIVFDEGIGDLFPVRVAGNTATLTHRYAVQYAFGGPYIADYLQEIEPVLAVVRSGPQAGV